MSQSASDSAAAEAPRLQQLAPAGALLTVEQAVEGLGLWQRPAEPAARPRVLLNMVSTVDGRASLDGRSGAIGGSADRELFHALRAASDAILVGAGTVRTERYGRPVGDPERRRLRVERGLSPEPLACIVSGRLVLDAEIPLLREPEAHVVVITSSAASLPALGAQVDYVRTTSGGALDLAAALEELGERFAVQLVLCEGGPHLARQLLGAGLLDELFLSVSPLLAAGEPAEGQALRIFAGMELEPPVGLDLLSTLASDSWLFLRYAVSGPI